MGKILNTAEKCPCGAWIDAEHLCDDPGPSLHGEAYTTLVATGVYRTPGGEYLTTPERIAAVLGADAAAKVVAACLDDEEDRLDVERARARHAEARLRLRRAANNLRAVAAMQQDVVLLTEVVA